LHVSEGLVILTFDLDEEVSSLFKVFLDINDLVMSLVLLRKLNSNNAIRNLVISC